MGFRFGKTGEEGNGAELISGKASEQCLDSHRLQFSSCFPSGELD